MPGRGVCSRGVPGHGGLLLKGCAWSRGFYSGGAAPGGRVPAPGGVCSKGGVPGGDPPGWLLLRAVHILLECILVWLFHWSGLDDWEVSEKNMGFMSPKSLETVSIRIKTILILRIMGENPDGKPPCIGCEGLKYIWCMAQAWRLMHSCAQVARMLVCSAHELLQWIFSSAWIQLLTKTFIYLKIPFNRNYIH